LRTLEHPHFELLEWEKQPYLLLPLLLPMLLLAIIANVISLDKMLYVSKYGKSRTFIAITWNDLIKKHAHLLL
jgi:hypothetical protein